MKELRVELLTYAILLFTTLLLGLLISGSPLQPFLLDHTLALYGVVIAQESLFLLIILVSLKAVGQNVASLHLRSEAEGWRKKKRQRIARWTWRVPWAQSWDLFSPPSGGRD